MKRNLSVENKLLKNKLATVGRQAEKANALQARLHDMAATARHWREQFNAAIEDSDSAYAALAQDYEELRASYNKLERTSNTTLYQWQRHLNSAHEELAQRHRDYRRLLRNSRWYVLLSLVCIGIVAYF